MLIVGDKDDCNICGSELSLHEIFDDIIDQRVGMGRTRNSKQVDKKYPIIMRMLRLMGVEVLWQSELDNMNPAEGVCIKDIDGCLCRRSKKMDDVLTQDKLLLERDGYYDVVLNLDTGSRLNATTKTDLLCMKKLHIEDLDDRKLTGLLHNLMWRLLYNFSLYHSE